MELNLTKISDLKKFHPKNLTSKTTISFNSISNEFHPEIIEKDKLYIINFSHLRNVKNVLSAAGIICINDTDDSNISFELNIPVILLDNRATFNEVFNIILEEIFNQQRCLEGKNRILDAFTSNKGINAILNYAAEIINSPFFFFDKSNILISSSTNIKIDDESWNEIISNRFIDYQKLSKNMKIDIIKDKDNNISLLNFPSNNRNAVYTNVYVEGKLIGYVGVYGFIKPVSDEVIEFIIFVSKIISAQMSKSDFYRFGNGNDYEFFFLDLLKSPPPMDILELRMKSFNIKLKDKFVVLVINSDIENINKNTKSLLVQNYITSIIKNCHSIIYKGNIVFIVELIDSFIPDKILSLIDIYLKDNKLIGGFSNPFNNISKLRIFYEQAITAIDYSKFRKNYKTINYFKDYIIDYILYICTDKTDFINLRHPAIDVLLKYDEKTNTQYLKTLKIYIDCLGNMSEAAQILKIHYNTMKHRIKTIENLTSISLKDTVTFLNIFISFRINEGLKDDFFKYE